MVGIGKFWRKIVTLLLVVVVCAGCSNLPKTVNNPWKVISIDIDGDTKLLDIAFAESQKHGFLVGSNSTLLETKDAGQSWEPIKLSLDAANFRFNGVSFADKEGWIVGEPALVLHSTDAGKSWSQIPLDEKLPGNPISVAALSGNTAEMATDVGAIYQTSDGGKNWKAQVQDAVGVVRNMTRSRDGKYVAISAKGNFYSTWEPGTGAWVPHNRNSSRRLENMGFTTNGKLWMLARGGQIQFTDPEDTEKWLDPKRPEKASSWGLLDMAYRTPDEIWVTGGSGSLLRSPDGGETWEKDTEVEEVPANFFKVVFFSPDQGFAIGDRGGYLLKYQPEAPEAA
jgi:photosystem II stability/assembly factor-like uncharacterized protein